MAVDTGSFCPGTWSRITVFRAMSNLHMGTTWGPRVPPSPGWARRHGRVWQVRMAGLWWVAAMATLRGIVSMEAAIAPDRQRWVCWGMLVFVSQQRTVVVPSLLAGFRPSGLNTTLPVLLVFGETQPDHRAPSSVPGADPHQRK